MSLFLTVCCFVFTVNGIVVGRCYQIINLQSLHGAIHHIRINLQINNFFLLFHFHVYCSLFHIRIARHFSFFLLNNALWPECIMIYINIANDFSLFCLFLYVRYINFYHPHKYYFCFRICSCLHLFYQFYLTCYIRTAQSNECGKNSQNTQLMSTKTVFQLN